MLSGGGQNKTKQKKWKEDFFFLKSWILSWNRQ
jgi:hypothetical protein